jgi:DNA helicase-2/ATP-dependent DNA helicase PcrA
MTKSPVVYERYQLLLRDNNALDFDDLLMQMVFYSTRIRRSSVYYQNRYEHILVDEFQDTNTAQYALVKQLAGQRRNVFCVGDEDQSIYRWRGADFRNVQRFRDQYPDAMVILLEQNYRSTQTILDAAQQVIARNVHRTPKKLFTQLGEGVPITLHEAYNEDDEAQFVIDTISTLIRTHDARAGDLAIMYRTNAQSRAIEDAFIRADPTGWSARHAFTLAARSRMCWLIFTWLTIHTTRLLSFASSMSHRAGSEPKRWRHWRKRRKTKASRRTR